MREITASEMSSAAGGMACEMGGNPFGAGPQSPATGAAQDSAGSFLAGYIVGVFGSAWEALTK